MNTQFFLKTELEIYFVMYSRIPYGLRLFSYAVSGNAFEK